MCFNLAKNRSSVWLVLVTSATFTRYVKEAAVSNITISSYISFIYSNTDGYNEAGNADPGFNSYL